MVQMSTLRGEYLSTISPTPLLTSKDCRGSIQARGIAMPPSRSLVQRDQLHFTLQPQTATPKSSIYSFYMVPMLIVLTSMVSPQRWLLKKMAGSNVRTILRQWIVNKDRDLRERETPLIIDERLEIPASPPSCRSKRLHVKRSMDTAFSMLRTADPLWKPREALVKTPDSSLLSSSPSFPPIDPNGRRPSLPQIIPHLLQRLIENKAP
jgi:hypothetical protein